MVFTSKCLVEVSLSEYISLTTHQKAFIFEPWVPERVSFYAMSLAPGFMPRGGAKGQNLGHCYNRFFALYLDDYLMLNMIPWNNESV